MKRLILGTGILALLMIGGSGANAQVGIYVDHDHHHRYWRDYDRDRHCRTVITHRINDRGDRVTVKKRVCD